MKKYPIIIFIFFCGFLGRSIAQNNTNSNVLGVWGHGNKVSKSIIKSMPFIHGWNFTFYWRELEPEKGKFNWKLFDDQIKIPIDNNLNVGFMVWVGQFSPEWVYEKDGVQKVYFNDKLHNDKYYPYYLNPAYKADYFAMLKAVGEHIKSLPMATRMKIQFWMSAEGSTGDETPYKAPPINPQFVISDKQWTDYKREAWSYMYQFGNSVEPKVHILINPANSGKYFDFVTKNFPTAWLKAGSLAHTYKFDGEIDYYSRLKKVVNPSNNGLNNRIRAESEEVQKIGWFKQSPQQNNFAIVTSSLFIGLDILNVRADIESMVGNNVYPFRFFNKYAGQRDPAIATGAFCVFRDVLDVNDTKRFPEDKYGKVISHIRATETKEDDAPANAGNNSKMPRPNEISLKRIQNILKEFEPYGAKNGTTSEEDKIVYKDDDKIEPKLKKENLRRDLTDKYFDDFGIDLIPGNYWRFLEQYSPNTTSRGYWRIGPVDQPFGRFARGFDHQSGMSEMFFSLDKDFFKKNNEPHKLQVKVVYFDKGKGEWSFNYYNGKSKVEKYKVRCTNTNRWIVKTIELTDVYTNKKLEHDTDFSLKYVSGDDTVFSMVEIRK